MRPARGLPGDAVYLLLGGGVYLRHDEHVGVAEGRDELSEERLCPRIAVRLEGDDDPALPHGAQRLQGRPYLRRVVAVVVDDLDLPVPFQLQPPVYAGELAEGLRHHVEADIELHAYRYRGKGVDDVVHARRRKVHLPEPAAPVKHVEPRAEAVMAQVDRPKVRLFRKAVGHIPSLEHGDEARKVLVVDAEDDEPEEGHLVHEGEKGALDLVDALCKSRGAPGPRSSRRRSSGKSMRNVPSLSSASATRYWLEPSFAFVPRLLSLPPITHVGSRPAPRITEATSEVVVVLPWAPATATLYFILISSASISALWITGMARAFASSTSGLSAFTADDVTTTWASRTFSALCP